MRGLLSLISGLLFCAAFFPYIIAIWRDRNKPIEDLEKVAPEKATWLIWGILDSVILAGMTIRHTTNWQIIFAATGALIIAALALRYGKPGWTILERFCLASGVIGIGLMFIKPEYAIAWSLTTLAIGSFPTITKAWANPKKEDKQAWAFFWTSCVAGVLAIPHWTIADAAQPLTFLAIDSIIAGIAFFRKVKTREELEARLATLDKEIAFVEEETRHYESIVRGIHSGATDLGSEYEQDRRTIREKDLRHNRMVLLNLHQEEERINRQLAKRQLPT